MNTVEQVCRWEGSHPSREGNRQFIETSYAGERAVRKFAQTYGLLPSIIRQRYAWSRKHYRPVKGEWVIELPTPGMSIEATRITVRISGNLI